MNHTHFFAHIPAAINCLAQTVNLLDTYYQHTATLQLFNAVYAQRKKHLTQKQVARCTHKIHTNAPENVTAAVMLDLAHILNGATTFDAVKK